MLLISLMLLFAWRPYCIDVSSHRHARWHRTLASLVSTPHACPHRRHARSLMRRYLCSHRHTRSHRSHCSISYRRSRTLSRRHHPVVHIVDTLVLTDTFVRIDAPPMPPFAIGLCTLILTSTSPVHIDTLARVNLHSRS